jgi:DNA-binding MarR family transcriptional regulator
MSTAGPTGAVPSERTPSLTFDPIAEARTRWSERWPEAERMAAATAIIRVQQIVMAAVQRALAPFDLTFARYEALVLLAFSRKGRLPLGKMGVRLQVHPTSVTNAIDRLERQGLVRRTAEPSDRRTTLAEITAEGRAVVEQATSAVVATQFGLGMLDETELTGLSQTLLDVRRSAGDFAER